MADRTDPTRFQPAPSSGTAPLRLWVEFALFFVLAPLVMAVFLPPDAMFPMLFTITAIGLVLLHLTPEFQWRDLVRGWGRINWRLVGIFALAMALISAAVVWIFAPYAAFFLIRHNPQIMLIILIFYPVVSALPQEIIYRVLFFRRYASLLPAGSPGLVLNAALFSLAHLLYWSWIVTIMTFAGGLLFAAIYRLKGDFPTTVVLHAVAGVILFAFGLGVFFYSGNVVRPF